MTTPSDAYAAMRTRLEAAALTDAAGTLLPLLWYSENDNPTLPDEPAPFVFTIFDASTSRTIEVGGGRGRNRHRNPSRADIFIFVPRGSGLKAATDIAEAIAAVYRPLNDSGVTVESATVYPGGPGSNLTIPGLPSEVGNYFYSAVGIEFYFDLIG